MPFLATINSSIELSTAHTKTFRSGRAERMVHKIEYTSAPMLQPSTAILKVEPLTFSLIRRRISSSAGRFRRKNVPKYCSRAAWRQTKLCMHAPYARIGSKLRTREGRSCQIRLLRRK